MSLANRPPMHIALPPRLSLSLSRTDSLESSASTPSPHTPLPYELTIAPELVAQHVTNDIHLNALEVSSSAGAKRSRDEENLERVEQEWTDEEMDVLQSTLIHPYRPISVQYPPGELPPPNAIDELTGQILTYAFRSSSNDHGHGGWNHDWDATRRKLFELALAESKFGGDTATRKERATRPGLRRVDSMDFLDQEPVDKGSDKMGRALRLSTSLQNSAKQDPVLVSMTRSTSLSSALGTGSISANASSPPISIIPSSPVPIPTPPARSRGSFRASQSRPARPASLLQRGRSFTASDLQAEIEEDSESSPTPIQDTPIQETVLERSPTSEDDKILFSTSPDSAVPVPPVLLPLVKSAPRMTRSHSSSALILPGAHTTRNAFLASPKPSSTDRSTLATPLALGRPEPISTSGWSDSEDDLPVKPKRAVKKLKGGRPKVRVHVAEVVRTEDLLLGGDLRSPFEEKDLQF